MNPVEQCELYRKVIKELKLADLEQELVKTDLELNNLPAEGLSEQPSAVGEQSNITPASNGALHALIRDMSMPQKIKLALFGNQTARALLIRDSNRQVAGTVLQNPKLTPGEIQELARNTQVDESILRFIASNLEWMKAYQLKLAIVSNPKCPIDIALRWVKYLQEKDLRKIAKSKNLPQVIAAQARKLLEQGS